MISIESFEALCQAIANIGLRLAAIEAALATLDNNDAVFQKSLESHRAVIEDIRANIEDIDACLIDHDMATRNPNPTKEILQ